MNKICIYSGTFNPVHNAHIKVAQGVLEALALDKIILIPNNIPPHKHPEGVISPQDRLQMLKLAFNSEKFEISDIELQMGGKSYSLNTIKQIKNTYKSAGKINFIVGTDAFKGLKSWHKYEELIQIVNFVVVPRENDADIHQIAKDLSIKGLSYSVVDLPFIDISSSEIRHQAKTGGALSSLLPIEIAKYIEEKKLFQSFSFDEIKILIEQNFNGDMIHSIAVSDLATELAQQNEVNPAKAKLAGIMHDCAKRLPIEEQKMLIEENQIEIFEHELDAPKTIHAPVGAYLAKEYFNIDDSEILDAIRFHTIGRKNMSPLEKVVFLADKIEPVTREADFRAKIEPLIAQGIDAAILKYFELLTEKLQNEGKKITPYTKDVIGYFQKQI